MATDSNTHNLAYNIRPVRHSDAAQLVQNIWQNRTLESTSTYLAEIEKRFAKGHAIGIIAELERNQHIIGYSLLSRLVKRHEISDVIVAETYQGKGIGTAMIKYLIQQINRQNALPLEIGVAASNIRALALYQRLGFVQHYHRMLDMGQGEERIIYLRLGCH